MFELVKKSSHVIDIYRLKEAIDNIPIDYKNQQISLKRVGCAIPPTRYIYLVIFEE